MLLADILLNEVAQYGLQIIRTPKDIVQYIGNTIQKYGVTLQWEEYSDSLSEKILNNGWQTHWAICYDSVDNIEPFIRNIIGGFIGPIKLKHDFGVVSTLTGSVDGCVVQIIYREHINNACLIKFVSRVEDENS